MELTESQIWLNPITDINYINYEQGLIKSYRLGFQDEEWYLKNKDNFCNSIKDNYPNLLPSFVKNYDPALLLPNNYLGFYPDEFIRYGFLEQADVLVDGKIARFWVVKVPAGLQIYHSSRSLGLNHTDFPIRGYSDNITDNENRENIFNNCPMEDFLGKKSSDVIKGNICTYVSYYSTPYVTKEYISKDVGFGSSQIKYAYGIDSPSTDRNLNDRMKNQSDKYFLGVQAYTLLKDTYFVILGLDDYLIERPDLGRENMKLFKRTMEFLYPIIQQIMNVDNYTMNNFLNLIDSVTGIGSLDDNVRMIMKDYDNPNFRYAVLNWIERNGNTYLKSGEKTNTAGYIKNTAAGVKAGITDLNRYKGVRFSTFEHDRPVMNMLGWLFGNYPIQSIKNDGEKIIVSGFVSSSMFVPLGLTGIKDRQYIRKGLSYYIPEGLFHSEVGMFFAPSQLVRNKNNKFDIDYSLNYLGIAQELRKYKTTNIMHYGNNINGNMTVNGFHQGHLFEHSMWVGLVAGNLYNKHPFIDFKQEIFKQEISKDIYLIAGYIHDLGKSGECTENAVYKGLDYQDPHLSICSFVTEKDIIGMKYFDIPEHPEKGYEYLKGYKVYKKFTLSGLGNSREYQDNATLIYFQDWEDMFHNLNVNDYHKKLIRIAVATHWYYGNAIKNISVNGEKIIKEFIRKIEIFYNDEFYKFRKDEFYTVIMFVIVLSVADIIGSQYDPTLNSTGLNDDQKATLINFLPNISQNELNPNDPTPMVDQIIKYALELQSNSVFKQDIISNVLDNLKEFLKNVSRYVEYDFNFNPSNTYSILYNLINSYPSVVDIKNAYSSRFPTVIAFDLDQTLLSTTFNSNGLSSYYIYPDTFKVIEEVQKLRKIYFPDNPTYIAITSRHYSPKSLLNLLTSESYNGNPNPLYYTNFDYIISRYTGSNDKILKDMSNITNFFNYNGFPKDGFVMDIENNSYRNIPDNDPYFSDINKISKYGHFTMIKNKYGIDYDNILSFDDDRRYFKINNNEEDDVMVAGVLKSDNIKDQGIRESLFKQGVAYFVFNKI